MNITFQKIGIFLAGITVGAFVTKTLLEKKYEEIIADLEDELNPPESDEYCDQDLQNTRELCEKQAKFDVELMKRQMQDVNTNQDKVISINQGGVKKIARNYNAMFTGQDPDSVVAVPKTSFGCPISAEKAYIIPVQNFNDGEEGFEQTTITYYAEDDTLVDENEEPIADTVEVVGNAALDNFGTDSEDPDIVYVRNERLSTDYEVIRVHKSYAETMGM